jgi:hypothetical protein
MYVRVTTTDVGPEGIDTSIQQLRGVIFPQARSTAGWEGATVLVNRETGIMRTLAFWESQEALEASVELANRLRSQFVQNTGGSKVLSVEDLEVALQVTPED